MRRARPHAGGAVLLWFGVLGAPFAWAAQHVTGYALTEATCSTAAARNGWGVPLDAWTIVVTSVAVAAGVGSLAAAIATFRAVYDAGSEPPRGRIRFLAVIGITIAPLFLAIMLMSGLGVLFLNRCAQG